MFNSRSSFLFSHSFRSFATTSVSPFLPHPQIPGFFFARSLLSPLQYQDFLGLLQQLQPGSPERFGHDVFAGLVFPESSLMGQFEAQLRPIVDAIPFFHSLLALGVVLLRYGSTGALPPHLDDPQKYGAAVCTIGFGSPAVLQMQLPRQHRSDSQHENALKNADVNNTIEGQHFLNPLTQEDPFLQRILLEPGSAYVMSGEARTRWLHGIEGGSTIALPDGRVISRDTRYALLLTPPRPHYVGALLLRHPNLPGGASLVYSEQGGVVVDTSKGSEIWDEKRVLQALEENSFPF